MTGAEDDPGAAARPDAAAHDDVHLVDWRGTGLRLRRGAVAVGSAVVVAWLVGGVVGGGGPSLRGLAGWVGAGLALLFVAEVVVVGGAALRGLLRAGEAGERLAGGDVGLLPRLPRRGGGDGERGGTGD